MGARRVPLFAVAAALAVALTAAVAWPAAGRQPARAATTAAVSSRMPDLLGSPLASAKKAMTKSAAALTYATRTVDSPEPAGTVVAQTPMIGAPVTTGTTIVLALSSGTLAKSRGIAPAYYTGQGIWYALTPDSCAGANCSVIISVQAPWAGSGPRPNPLGVLEYGGCAHAWDQNGDFTYANNGYWYAATSLNITNNQCGANDHWRLSFSHT